MPKVVLARRARAELLKLDPTLGEAVEESIALLAREPYAGHRLRGRLAGLRSLRSGSYRVLYELRDDDQIIRVAAIRHRATAYGSDPR